MEESRKFTFTGTYNACENTVIATCIVVSIFRDHKVFRIMFFESMTTFVPQKRQLKVTKRTSVTS